MSWIAVAMTVVGAAVSAYNSNKTLKKQDRETVRAIRRQRTQTEASNKRVRETVDQLASSDDRKARADAGKKYLSALNLGQGQPQTTLGGTLGGVSEDYRQAAARSAANESAYAGDTAGLMASQDAPFSQRLGESFALGNLDTDIRSIASIADGNAGVDQLRIQGVRRNPWLDLAGSALSSYGANAGGGAATAGGSGKMKSGANRKG